MRPLPPDQLGGPVYVVKAQIHAGGRGKAGGVKVVSSSDEVASVATELLGKTLVTHQTGPQGREVNVSISKRDATSAKSCICRFWSTVAAAA